MATSDYEKRKKKKTNQAKAGHLLAPVLYEKTEFDAATFIDIAVAVVVIMVLGLFIYLVPFFNTMAPLIMPIPLILLVMRRGPLAGIITAALCLAAFIPICSLGFALVISAEYAVLGLFFGVAFIKKVRPIWILAIGSVISAATTAGVYFITVAASGLPMDQAIDSILFYINNKLQGWGTTDSFQKFVPPGLTWDEYVAQVNEYAVAIIPAAFVINAMLMTFLDYAIAVLTMRKIGYTIEKLPPLDMWKLDWRLLFVLIGALALYLGGHYTDNDIMVKVAANILYVFASILFVCSCSLFYWFVKRWGAPNFIRAVTVGAIAFTFIYTVPILMLTGVFDPLINFRRRMEVIDRDYIIRKNKNRNKI